MARIRANEVVSRLVGAGLALLLSGCDAGLREFVFDGETMGTTYRVKVVVEAMDEADRERLAGALAAEVEQVDAAMSTYRPNSELSRFNRWESDQAFPMSLATFEVFEAALEIGRRSGGALDITIGAVVDKWGFGPTAESSLNDSMLFPEPTNPSSEIGDSVAGPVVPSSAPVGIDRLELDRENHSVRKLVPEVECDLSAVAKGFGVDSVARLLTGNGYRNYLVEVGGEIRVSGINVEGQAWRLGIEKPTLARGEVHRLVPLTDLAMATSGTYRNSRRLEGQTVSHIIDPRTGQPITHQLISATVVARQCAIADAWATAIMVVGPQEGLQLAQQEGLAILLLVEEGDTIREYMSPAFSMLVQK